MDLPDRKMFPDYFQIIPELICLNMIKVSCSPYDSLQQARITNPALGPAQEEESLQDTRGFPKRFAFGLFECPVL